MEEKTEDNEKVMPYPFSAPNQELASIASLLKETQTLLPALRREFRGEVVYYYSDGSYEAVQVSKPVFVEMDLKTNKPIKIKVTYKEGKVKEIYKPNDEAIEEVLSMLKFMGINQFTPLTNLDENTILEDLKEFECKLAGILALKQKSWGLDKELLPIIMTKIKTIVQDARYLACEGNTIKAIQKTVQRIEQFHEGKKTGMGRIYSGGIA